MSRTEVILKSTLSSDGTVQVDQKPNLPAGRVQAVLRPELSAEPASEGWWPFMQRARRELEAAGSQFMTEAEVNAHVAWLHAGDRVDDLLRDVNPQR